MKSLLVGTGTIFATPFDIYLSNVILHFLQKSYAHAAGDLQAFSDQKFIHLSMYGGAPRWYWDQPLRPNGNDDMGTKNDMLITRFNIESGAVTGGSYATHRVGNFHLPHMWSGRMPTTDGQSAPMSALAENMLAIRGIDLRADGHDSNRFLQTKPTAGTSLLGMIADSATTPIPATSYGQGNPYYYSSKGVGIVETGSGTPLRDFMNPFINSGSLQMVRSSNFEASIDRALKLMGQSSGAKHRFLPSTYEQRLNAKELLKRDFGNIQDIYTSLFNKYSNLISRSFGDASLALEGVEDRHIESVTTDHRYRLGVGDSQFYKPGDLRSITDSQTGIGGLAASMAVAEYMATQGFSSAINVHSGDLYNLNSTGGFYPARSNAPTGARVGVSIDCHEQGAYANLIIQTRNYRAHSACLFELINQLKRVSTAQGNLFQQTSIAVTSEFSRAPRGDGSGSDHGFQGTNYAIYNGSLPTTTVVGNTREANGYYTGKWYAGPVEELGGREALIGNVASTFAAMVGMKSPTPNDASFVYKKDGVILPSFKGPKNV
jgi:hypothetical protein